MEEELEFHLKQIKSTTPQIGISLTISRLGSVGYHVTRGRVRQALKQRDPLTTAIRWSGRLNNRWPYSVAGPHSLWHVGLVSSVCTISKALPQVLYFVSRPFFGFFISCIKARNINSGI